jgi:hypothetical protein
MAQCNDINTTCQVLCVCVFFFPCASVDTCCCFFPIDQKMKTHCTSMFCTFPFCFYFVFMFTFVCCIDVFILMVRWRRVMRVHRSSRPRQRMWVVWQAYRPSVEIHRVILSARWMMVGGRTPLIFF